MQNIYRVNKKKSFFFGKYLIIFAVSLIEDAVLSSKMTVSNASIRGVIFEGIFGFFPPSGGKKSGCGVGDLTFFTASWRENVFLLEVLNLKKHCPGIQASHWNPYNNMNHSV